MNSSTNREINQIDIAIIGGSGFWTELNHIKNILLIRDKYPVKLCVIVDPINPRTMTVHKNLNKIISLDNTTWVNPSDFADTDAIINELKQKFDINLVIISSNPTTHFDYGMSCIKYNVDTVCDKPIISSTNASTDSIYARQMMSDFYKLQSAYNEAKMQNSNLMFHSILRRRGLAPFRYVAEQLDKVYCEKNAGINDMTIQISGGIYKFPNEFLATGAHGYLDGVGSLAHSAYHYFDILAWYLSLAPGSAVKITSKLNYSLRIKDYLDSKLYTPLQNTLDLKNDLNQGNNIPANVLGCELNSGFSFILKDNNDKMVGEISFLFNHVTFTPRTLGNNLSINEPANRTNGGRMSKMYIDINQGGLQSFRITKDDIVFETNEIKVDGRRHPNITGLSRFSKIYPNAYENEEYSMSSLFEQVIIHMLDGTSIENHPVIRDLNDECLAMELYSACYELLANEYADPDKANSVADISLTK
jgi:hypothetical protein